MSMPKNLILIRHGESESNLVQRKAKKEGTPFPEWYFNTPDREIRLSKKGIDQTKETGEYLKNLFPNGVDVIYVSDHTRAKETAALVCLHAGWDQVKIKIEPQFGERHWGNFHHYSTEERAKFLADKKRDPLHFAMPDGETLLGTRARTRILLERCDRQHSNQNVIVFSHGEYLEAVWSEISHMRTETQRTFFASIEGDIKNCQVVEFKSGANGKFSQLRSSNPYLSEFGSWTPIVREDLTPNEILAEVNLYPNLVDE